MAKITILELDEDSGVVKNLKAFSERPFFTEADGNS